MPAQTAKKLLQVRVPYRSINRFLVANYPSLGYLDPGAYVPCPLERYFQILLPVLRLCASVMVHGDSNASKRVSVCKAGILLSLTRFVMSPKALSGFFSAHRDVLLLFLRERPTYLFIGSVEILQLLVVMVHRIQVNVSAAERVSTRPLREESCFRADSLVIIRLPLTASEGSKLPWNRLEPNSLPTSGSNSSGRSPWKRHKRSMAAQPTVCPSS